WSNFPRRVESSFLRPCTLSPGREWTYRVKTLESLHSRTCRGPSMPFHCALRGLTHTRPPSRSSPDARNCRVLLSSPPGCGGTLPGAFFAAKAFSMPSFHTWRGGGGCSSSPALGHLPIGMDLWIY